MQPNQPSDRLLKYPLMERQDLNQSQLGSFKFTPVDNVQSLTAVATNYLQQQLAENLAKASPFNQNKANFVLGDNATPGINLTQQSSTADPNFFNKHIKPDIGDSRLRLGPAALRSAVTGAATSPTKTDRLNIDRYEFDNALSYHHHTRSLDVSVLTSLQLVDLDSSH